MPNDTNNLIFLIDQYHDAAKNRGEIRIDENGNNLLHLLTDLANKSDEKNPVGQLSPRPDHLEPRSDHLGPRSFDQLTPALQIQLLNMENKQKRTPLAELLHMPGYNSKIILGYAFIKAGANPATTNSDGNTWLHYLVKTLKVIEELSVKMLCSYIYDSHIGLNQLIAPTQLTLLQAKDSKGQTPYQKLLNGTTISLDRRVKMGAHFLRAGTTPDTVDKEGHNWLHLTILLLTTNNHTEAERYLDGSAEHSFAKFQPQTRMKLLEGNTLKRKGGHGMTPLDLLLSLSELSTKKRLLHSMQMITLGASLSREAMKTIAELFFQLLKENDYEEIYKISLSLPPNSHQPLMSYKTPTTGETLLETVYNDDQLSIDMKLMIALQLFRIGANISTTDRNGNNFYHLIALYADEHWHPNTLSLPIIKDWLTAKNSDSLTPLALLLNRYDKFTNKKGWFITAYILLKAGASPLETDSNGNTILHIFIKTLFINVYDPIPAWPAFKEIKGKWKGKFELLPSSSESDRKTLIKSTNTDKKTPFALFLDIVTQTQSPQLHPMLIIKTGMQYLRWQTSLTDTLEETVLLQQSFTSLMQSIKNLATIAAKIGHFHEYVEVILSRIYALQQIREGGQQSVEEHRLNLLSSAQLSSETFVFFAKEILKTQAGVAFLINKLSQTLNLNKAEDLDNLLKTAYEIDKNQFEKLVLTKMATMDDDQALRLAQEILEKNETKRSELSDVFWKPRGKHACNPSHRGSALHAINQKRKALEKKQKSKGKAKVNILSFREFRAHESKSANKQDEILNDAINYSL